MIIEILKYHMPDFVFLENVKNLVTHDKGNTMYTIYNSLIKLGYHVKYKILNSADITKVPQNRERIYITCFKNKQYFDKFNYDFPLIKNSPIINFLENNVHDKYYYTNKYKRYDTFKTNIIKHISTNTVYQYRRYYVRENKKQLCPTLTCNMGQGGHNVPLILDDFGIRKLTPRECFNLQGFSKKYNLGNLNDNQLYCLAGNSVCCQVIELLIEKLVASME